MSAALRPMLSQSSSWSDVLALRSSHIKNESKNFHLAFTNSSALSLEASITLKPASTWTTSHLLWILTVKKERNVFTSMARRKVSRAKLCWWSLLFHRVTSAAYLRDWPLKSRPTTAPLLTRLVLLSIVCNMCWKFCGRILTVNWREITTILNRWTGCMRSPCKEPNSSKSKESLRCWQWALLKISFLPLRAQMRWLPQSWLGKC